MGWQASEWLVDMALTGALAAGGAAAAYAAGRDLGNGSEPERLAPSVSERQAILDELGRRAAAERR